MQNLFRQSLHCNLTLLAQQQKPGHHYDGMVAELLHRHS